MKFVISIGDIIDIIFFGIGILILITCLIVAKIGDIGEKIQRKVNKDDDTRGEE